RSRRVLDDLHPGEGEDEDRPQIGQEKGQSDLVPADQHRQQRQAPRHAGDDEEQHEDAGRVTASGASPWRRNPLSTRLVSKNRNGNMMTSTPVQMPAHTASASSVSRGPFSSIRPVYGATRAT